MHSVRGYCGRDERRDCPEMTTRAKLDVQFRRVKHPGELFLSFDEWNEQLGAIIERYNATSQDGRALQGLSPDEAFEKYWPHDNPPQRMDANCWHLVSNCVRPIKVTVNGICFRIGKNQFVYRNERTGQDRGKTVLAWFDPECPDFLCVTDMNRKDPYLVERATGVDYRAAAGDPDLERELGKAAAHSIYPKARYHTLKAKFAQTFRRNIVDAETAQTAQVITQQREAMLAEQKQETKVRTAYRKAGMPVPGAGRLEPEAIDDFKRLEELRRKAYQTTEDES